MEILSGFGKKISRRGRKITGLGNLNKSSENWRDSNIIVDWSDDIDGSSVPKMDSVRTKTVNIKEICRSKGTFKNAIVPDRAVYNIPRDGENSTNVNLKYLQNQLAGLRQEINKDLESQLDQKCDKKCLDDTIKESQLDEIREEMKNQAQRVVQQLMEENKASLREFRREIKRFNRKY